MITLSKSPLWEMLNESVALIEGDAAEVGWVIAPGTVDLLVTSPPYHLGKSYDDSGGFASYVQGQGDIIQRLLPLMKPQGSICWQVGNYVTNGEVIPLDYVFYRIFSEAGWKLRNRIVWRFGHGLHAKRRFSGRYETILWMTRSSTYTFNLDAVRVPSKYPGKKHYKGPRRGLPSCHPQGKNPGDVWDLLSQDWEDGVFDIPNVKSNHCEKTQHPCQFPVEVAERCILALTNEGDTVLDPFCGSGSTLLAAMRCGRRVVGIERCSDYCKTTRERVRGYIDGSVKVRPLCQPIHNPHPPSSPPCP